MRSVLLPEAHDLVRYLHGLLERPRGDEGVRRGLQGAQLPLCVSKIRPPQGAHPECQHRLVNEPALHVPISRREQGVRLLVLKLDVLVLLHMLLIMLGMYNELMLLNVGRRRS